MSKQEAVCPSCGRTNCLSIKTDVPIFHIWEKTIVTDICHRQKKIECCNCGYSYEYDGDNDVIAKVTGCNQMNDGDVIQVDGAILEYRSDHGDLSYSCTMSDANYYIEGKEVHYYGQGRYKFVKGEDNENNPS